MQFQPVSQQTLKSLVNLLEKEHLCIEDIDLETQCFEAIVDKGQVVGGFGLEITNAGALLRSVVLHSKLRGQGIGEKIVQRALALAKQKDIHVLYLLTTTAGSFFKNLGFSKISRSTVPEPIGQTVEFKSFCPDTAVCMKLTIPTYV